MILPTLYQSSLILILAACNLQPDKYPRQIRWIFPNKRSSDYNERPYVYSWAFLCSKEWTKLWTQLTLHYKYLSPHRTWYNILHWTPNDSNAKHTQWRRTMGQGNGAPNPFREACVNAYASKQSSVPGNVTSVIPSFPCERRRPKRSLDSDGRECRTVAQGLPPSPTDWTNTTGCIPAYVPERTWTVRIRCRTIRPRAPT